MCRNVSRAGTLTQNEMVFKRLHLGTVSYGTDTMDEIQSHIIQSYAQVCNESWGDPESRSTETTLLTAAGPDIITRWCFCCVCAAVEVFPIFRPPHLSLRCSRMWRSTETTKTKQNSSLRIWQSVSGRGRGSSMIQKQSHISLMFTLFTLRTPAAPCRSVLIHFYIPLTMSFPGNRPVLFIHHVSPERLPVL